MTELFLFSAARYEIIDKVIKPALELGKIVVCDRFSVDSSLPRIRARGILRTNIIREHTGDTGTDTITCVST